MSHFETHVFSLSYLTNSVQLLQKSIENQIFRMCIYIGLRMFMYKVLIVDNEAHTRTPCARAYPFLSVLLIYLKFGRPLP